MRRETTRSSGSRIRLCFLSYRHLSALARSVMDEYAARAEIEVIDRSFDAALAVARERERAGTVDAFVSAGANASFLRGSLTLPVATIKVSGYDILLALLEARKLSDRVGVVTHRETIQELDAVKDVLRIEVAQMAYTTPESAEACARKLAADGFPVIIGSSVVVEAAERHGLHGILGYSLSSVRQGFEDALELGRVSRIENARYEQINAVLQTLQDAVLAVDQRDRIIALNHPMEVLLGAAGNTLIGRRVSEVEPDISLAETIASGAEERAQVLRLKRRDWIVNRRPIREQGITTGAVVTLTDARAINEADGSLRSQRKSRGRPAARYRLDDIRGASPALGRARETARRFATTDLTVLISGESGTGKELFAQAIHNLSARSDRPFIPVNCSAFPETLLESELFGYEEGAFTGSRKGGKFGLFEAAHTGTLFLDEIGDMPLTLQTRLLRVLQEREVIRLGGTAPIPVDVRILAATHQPLDAQVRERRFRSDLFYRLNTLHLRLPPLRERREDVELLAYGFVARCLERHRLACDPATVLRPLMSRLTAYDWPGNVRELENICERLAILGAQTGFGSALQLDLIAEDCPELFAGGAPDEGEPENLAHRIPHVLAACGGNRQRAARALGISRATLWRHMRRLETRDGEGSVA